MKAKGVWKERIFDTYYSTEQWTETNLGQVFAVFHPPAVRATVANGTEATRDGPRSTVLKETVRGVPDGMVPVIARFVGELDATAAAAVSDKIISVV